MPRLTKFNVFALVVFPAIVHAGAGAVVQACYYSAVDPISPIQVSFVAGGAGDQCLNDSGKNVDIVITNLGLTCGNAGYVEGKDSDTGLDDCAALDSIWTLSYTTNDTSDTSSAQSKWVSGWLVDNHVYLENESNGTVVCGAEALCTSTDLKWDHGLGPLYFIFNPGSSPSLVQSDGTKFPSVIDQNVLDL